jgi:hypothetical protein
VSKALPAVVIVTWPFVMAVQRYQIELVPLKPPVGSPVSKVALPLPPLTVPIAPTRTWAAAKLLFAGGGPGV